MKAKDIMTSDPVCCPPDTTSQEVASYMEQHDCGCVPIVEDLQSRRLVGVVTDRDIAIHGVGRGTGPQTPIREVMTAGTVCCTPHADVEDVERAMSENKVRRVPVLEQDDRLVGMVSQADVARARRDVGEENVARVVEDISEPTAGASEAPKRRQVIGR